MIKVLNQKRNNIVECKDISIDVGNYDSISLYVISSYNARNETRILGVYSTQRQALDVLECMVSHIDGRRGEFTEVFRMPKDNGVDNEI